MKSKLCRASFVFFRSPFTVYCHRLNKVTSAPLGEMTVVFTPTSGVRLTPAVSSFHTAVLPHSSPAYSPLAARFFASRRAASTRPCADAWPRPRAVHFLSLRKAVAMSTFSGFLERCVTSSPMTSLYIGSPDDAVAVLLPDLHEETGRYHWRTVQPAMSAWRRYSCRYGCLWSRSCGLCGESVFLSRQSITGAEYSAPPHFACRCSFCSYRSP